MLCRGELEHRIEEKRTSGKRPVGSEKAHALMATTQASLIDAPRSSTLQGSKFSMAK